MDPYSTSRFLDLPDLQLDSPYQLALSIQDLHCDTFSLAKAEHQPLNDLQVGFFKLEVSDASLPDLDSSRVSSISDDEERSTEVGDVEALPDHEENIWTLPDVYTKVATTGLTSWDTFLNKTPADRLPQYISEAGPLVFDNYILHQAKDGEHSVPKIAKRNLVLTSLLELAAGRESALFCYDGAKGDIVSRTDQFTISGVSQSLLGRIVLHCAQTGYEFRQLRNYSQATIKGHMAQDSLRVALAGAVSVVLYAVEGHLEEQRRQIQSILQVEELFDRPSRTLQSLSHLLKCTSEQSGPEPSMKALLSEAQLQSDGSQSVEDVVHEVLARTAEPQQRAIERSIGLRETFQGDDDLNHTLSQALPEDAQKLFSETRESLALLRENKSDHVLLHSMHTEHISLEWHNTWEEIDGLHHRALEHEKRLKEAICFIRHDSPGQAINLHPAQPSPASPPCEMHGGTLLDIDGPGHFCPLLCSKTDPTQDKLYRLVQTALKDDQVSNILLRPPLDQSLALSLSPMLAIQHRLSSFSVMELLFQTHGLRLHLNLQYRFHLFGDGDFSSRLTHALFDPGQATGEGRRKTNAGRTGLRLQSRDTWPPASSELRLVLTGILTESITSQSRVKVVDSNLSDSMSFAIRNLSDGDLEKCRDADSIHALDFLRLQYKSSNPLLDAMFTPKSLELYDRIFRFLLTLLRVKSVAENLLRAVSNRRSSLQTRPDHKFRLEIQHLASVLASWTQDVVINQGWHELDATIARVEKCLKARDFDGVLYHGKSLAFLRNLHEETLANILRSLFLNRKQSDMKEHVDGIMSSVLRFAKADRDGDVDATVARAREEFRNRMAKFLKHLKWQVRDDRKETWTAVHEQLLLRLDMFGYYV